MENNFSSTLAYRSALHEIPSGPARPTQGDSQERLEVIVLFTGIQHTLHALKKAAELARDLNAQIRLVVPQLVPYPLPLESPPVLLEFNERRFQTLAAKQAIETRVEIFLGRDLDGMLEAALAPRSTVVMGGCKRWWPTKEERIARRLRRVGHEVIFVSDVSKEDRVYA